jgi:outer membrane protease
MGFGPYSPWYNVSTPGPVLTYEVTYVIPYVGVQSGYRFAKGFQAMIDLGASPFVSAKDTDDHLLRGKSSEGSTTGSAYFAMAGIEWSLTERDLVRLNGQYLKITTTGTQTQTWYRNDGTIPAGTTYTGIPDRIDSEQTSLSLLLSHRF